MFTVVSLTGWGLNLYKLAQLDSVLTGVVAIRILSVPVLPMGAVVGYIDFDKEQAL